MLCLSKKFTQVVQTEEELKEGMSLAMWVTASSCEHTWTNEQAAKMARALLWHHQRLSAVRYAAKESNELLHPPKEE